MLRNTLLSLIGFVLALSATAAEYDLTIDQRPVLIGGVSSDALTINGQVPGPTLRFREGEDVVIHVTNKLTEDTALHWHGLLLPGQMDGVPGLNGFPGIAPGRSFTYRFKARQSGTYWYHSHSGTQEQAGIYGPLIIEPKDPEPVQASRDYVIMLSDFTDTNGMEILRNLKNDHEHYNRGRRTISDFVHDLNTRGTSATFRDRKDWGEMRMDPTDLADVSGYTFLINGKSTADNWTGLFKPGERVRLRFINGSSMSFMDVRIPGLRMVLVQADGQNVEPVPVDEFRIAPAETYDVMVTPKDDKAYAIFAEPIDRSGSVRATLAPREGMAADIPPSRPRAILSMNDMGMSHDMNMSHEGMAAPQGGMQHDHSGHAPETAAETSPDNHPVGWANASTPPGAKALNYSDLRSFAPQADVREPSREIIVHLGGSMARYTWTINGQNAEHAHPINLKYNERVKLTFVNDTMMAHPMHLHGMFVQLLNGQPADHLPNKHTVSIAPGKSYSVLLTANQPGEWAFHCHLLYHMVSGMMTKVVVARYDGGEAR